MRRRRNLRAIFSLIFLSNERDVKAFLKSLPPEKQRVRHRPYSFFKMCTNTVPKNGSISGGCTCLCPTVPSIERFPYQISLHNRLRRCNLLVNHGTFSHMNEDYKMSEDERGPIEREAQEEDGRAEGGSLLFNSL